MEKSTFPVTCKSDLTMSKGEKKEGESEWSVLKQVSWNWKGMNGNVSFRPSHLSSTVAHIRWAKEKDTIEFMTEDMRKRPKCILNTDKRWLS